MKKYLAATVFVLCWLVLCTFARAGCTETVTKTPIRPQPNWTKGLTQVTWVVECSGATDFQGTTAAKNLTGKIVEIKHTPDATYPDNSGADFYLTMVSGTTTAGTDVLWGAGMNLGALTAIAVPATTTSYKDVFLFDETVYLQAEILSGSSDYFTIELILENP